jgi:hypothetical protein
MATVEIQDAMNCTIDGVPSGQPIDCIVNHPRIAPDIQRALVEWQQRVAERHQAEKAALQADLATIAAERDALGGTEEANRIRRETRAAELQKQVQEAQAELAKLLSPGES